jgi:hypothetical protein
VSANAQLESGTVSGLLRSECFLKKTMFPFGWRLVSYNFQYAYEMYLVL